MNPTMKIGLMAGMMLLTTLSVSGNVAADPCSVTLTVGPSDPFQDWRVSIIPFVLEVGKYPVTWNIHEAWKCLHA